MGSAVLVLAAGWAAGIASVLALSIPVPLLVLAALATLSAAVVAPAGLVRLAALGALAVLLGLGRGALAVDPGPNGPASGQLQPYVGRVAIAGRVLDAPRPRGSRVELLVEVETVGEPGRGAARALLGEPRPRVLVRATAAPVSFDDRIEAFGVLARPRSRPGWPLAEILARRGVHWVVDAGAVRLVEPAGPSLTGALTAVRTTLEANTRAILPEPHASLVSGIVFGSRSGLPSELRAALTATGTSHLTAVSGFNVAIVAGVLQIVTTRLLGRGMAVVVALAGVWLYTVLVGAPPSAQRAAMMATCALAAQAAGRLPDPAVLLSLAVAVLLGWEPGLAFDLGFQLSAAATAGLILLAGPLDRQLAWLPTPLREPTGVALAAQLATLPLVLGTFQTISLVAVPANILAAPLVPTIMYLGVTLALLAPLPGFDVLLGWATWLATGALLAVIEGLAQVPGAVQRVGRPPLWLPVAWYGMLACWVAAGSPDVRRLGVHPATLRAGAGACAATMLVGSLLAQVGLGWADDPQVTLLDLEDGAALVRVPPGRTVLLLTTADGTNVAAALADQLGPWETTVDVVIGPAGLATGMDEVSRAIAGSASTSGHAGAGEPAEPGGAGVPALDGGQADAPAAPLSPGTRLALGPAVQVDVVDVRRHGERRVADLAILLDGLAVWLPGPGPPSERWSSASPDRPTVARLPTSAISWVRAAPARRWALFVGGAPADRVRALVSAPVLDQREHGAVELVPSDDGLDVRVDRCDGGRACLLTLVPSAEPSRRPLADDAADEPALQSESTGRTD